MRFVEPFAALHELAAEIAEMRHRAAEAGQPEAQKDAQDLEEGPPAAFAGLLGVADGGHPSAPFAGAATRDAEIRLPLCLWRRRRGELREVGEAERLFDPLHLSDGVFETVMPELLALDVLETLAHLAQLGFR